MYFYALFSEELKLGIQSGMYEYKIGGGWAFQSAPWMKGFFEEAFKRKAEAKKTRLWRMCGKSSSTQPTGSGVLGSMIRIVCLFRKRGHVIYTITSTEASF